MTIIYIGAFDWDTIGMSEDTWEGRMAIRAAIRRGIEEAQAFLAERVALPEPPPPPVGVPMG